MKNRLGIIGLFLALVIMSSMSVMATEETSWEVIENQPYGEETDEIIEHVETPQVNPVKEYARYTLAERMINWLVEKFDLSTEDSIGELLDALSNEKNDLEEEAMDHFGVETEEELKEAMKETRIETLREALDLDDSYSDEEVLEIAHQERLDLVKELLGLDADASDEEVKLAMEDWKEENKVLFKPKWRFSFWGR